MNDLYIVDAVNYLFRSYYAIGPMTNKEGHSTSALYGFIRSLQKLIKLFGPKHLICVFDGPDNKQMRTAIYEDYKAHRKEAPQDLFDQFDWAYEYCKLAGIPTLSLEGVEADDTMASIALWAQEQGATAYLCTSDKDLAQLVNSHIFLLHPHKDYRRVDAAMVEELFGVPPHQILDYLSITGDASDNIPGIPGFGPKTAVTLLKEFGSLDAILQNPEKIKGEKKQQVLRESKEIALLSRKLATLHIDLDIPKQMTFYQLQSQDIEGLKTFYQKMQFKTLLREIEEPKEAPAHAYHLINTEKELEKLLSTLSHTSAICIDTETTSLNPREAKLVGIGFCTKPNTAWYVPYSEAFLPLLKSFFARSQSPFFGHNLKYDLHVLENYGIQLPHIGFDTMLASYVLDPQNRRHNLDDLSLDKFAHVKIPIESLIGKGKSQISMEDVPIEKLTEYCCEDVDMSTRLKLLFEEELHKKKLAPLFYEIEMPLVPILAAMETKGIYLDPECLALIGDRLEKTIHEKKTLIFEEANESFNLNSPKQLSSILFEKLQLKKPTKTKSSFATSADVLELLAEEHPIAQHLLEYRTLEKLRSTYVEALPLSIDPKTHRIHCTFNQSVTATGRLSCQNPNLQNIPVRTKEGNSIRSCFKPQKEGWSFLAADYSQIELRLLAHFSEDPQLLSAFNHEEDIHTYTASLIYNIPITMVTPEMRFSAKAVNFGIIYGQGAFGLSKQLHISMQEAATFIQTYFARYPKIQSYLDRCKEEARTLGYATTITGRKRPIPEILNKNPSIRAAAERLAINTPLQGTAADLIKKAMIAIHSQISHLKGFMILQIHDELIFEIPDEEIPIFKKIVKREMESVYPLQVPILVDIAIGKNWAEC